MEAARQAGQAWSSPDSHPDPAGESCGWIAIKERAKRKVPVIAVDGQELPTHVSGVVLQGVEETSDGLPEADAGPCARQSAMGVTFSAPGIAGGTCGPGRERFSPGSPPGCGICRLRPR